MGDNKKFQDTDSEIAVLCTLLYDVPDPQSKQDPSSELLWSMMNSNGEYGVIRGPVI